MSSSFANQLVRRLRRLADGTGPQPSDEELLRAFVRRRDPDAFTVIVERHGPLVLSVSRRVLRDASAAEDVFQATFLVLARRAGSVRKPGALAGWLHGVAYRLAKRALVEAARRQKRERLVALPAVARPDADPSWREVCAVLDEEVHRLPENYRVPLVLCHLEGRTRDQAARELRWSLRTLQRRLEQGRELLRRRLERRGVGLSSVLLVGELARQTATGRVSAGLVDQAARAGLAFAATETVGGGLVSGPAAGLAEGVLRAMLIEKFRSLTFFALAVAVVVAGAGLFAFRARATLPAEPVQKPAHTAIALAVPLEHKPSRPRQEQAKQLLKRAIEALENADNNGGLPDRALADIAVLQMKLGERAAADETFARARQVIGRGQRNDIFELRELARAYGRAGDGQAILDIVHKEIPDNVPNFRGNATEFRDMVLQEGAEALAKNGHGRDALRLADAVQKDETRKWARYQVRTELAERKAEAHQFAEARRTIESMEDPAERVRALTGMVYTNMSYGQLPQKPGLILLLAGAGRKEEASRALDEATELAEKVSDPRQKQGALAALVCVEVRLGRIEAARKRLKDIVNDAWFNIATAALAEQLGVAGKTEQALALIDRLPQETMKVHGLYHLAAGQARAGHRKEAAETFAKAVEQAAALPQQEQHIQFHNIASAQAEAGYFEDARQTLREHLNDAAVARANVAYELARAGKVDSALRLAEQMRDNDWWKANIFRGVARLQAERGEEKAALAWIEELSSKFLQGNALLGLAEGLVGRP